MGKSRESLFDGDHDDHEATAAALKRVREKVARTAKARNVNYPVLLDSNSHCDAGVERQGLIGHGE